MVKKNILNQKKKTVRLKSKFWLAVFLALISLFIFCLTLIAIILYQYENKYQLKIYPGIKIDHVSFGGKTPIEVEEYFSQKNKPFEKIKFTLVSEDNIATVSSKELKVAFDGKLSSVQAYSIGRSGNFFSDIYQKWQANTVGINLSSSLDINFEYLDEVLNQLAYNIDLPAQDALFQFENGKVTLFKPSRNGKKLDKQKTKQLISSYISQLARSSNNLDPEKKIDLPIEIINPSITTENSNNFGIKDLIGIGTSKFVGSIQGRIHNIELAASRINGHLVAPNEIFSFNNTLGDVSAATGYQPAYIIKDGRTVLGDGGGVCQVSTTLFRAALSAGLPIVERHAHSYRVSYYEQDSPVGIDATVFAPSYDLKFKNDSSNYLLIQAKTDRNNYSLTFEIYGTSDGRKVEMSKPVIFAQIPPPPDLYLDDPTLPKGTTKQVDWRAWGAKTSFDYKVIKNNEIIFQSSFFSNYQPWQAVFLRGARE